VTDSNMLMFVFVAGVLVVVAATAMRYVPQELYPITVFSVGLGTFLHQNLVTGFVVGADVQALYSTAQLLIEFQQWTPRTNRVVNQRPCRLTDSRYRISTYGSEPHNCVHSRKCGNICVRSTASLLPEQ